MSNRWLGSADVPRGDVYDARFTALEQSGQDVHGEAHFVAALGVSSVLDAGCGTGRVAIELARRGIDVVGVDLDATMLAVARHKARISPGMKAISRPLSWPGRRCQGSGTCLTPLCWRGMS